MRLFLLPLLYLYLILIMFVIWVIPYYLMVRIVWENNRSVFG